MTSDKTKIAVDGEACVCGDYRSQHPNDGPSALNYASPAGARCEGFRPDLPTRLTRAAERLHNEAACSRHESMERLMRDTADLCREARAALSALPQPAGERAQIVAWLRSQPEQSIYCHGALADQAERFADEIERGDHLGADRTGA